MMMRWVSLFFSFVHIVLIHLIYINVVFQDYIMYLIWSLNSMAFNMDRASILLLTNSPIIKLRKVNYILTIGLQVDY